jgi:predicted PurR-regulated permease PerM
MSTAPGVRWTTREVLVFWAVAALFAVLLLAFHVAAQALLLAFAGVLFGTGLRGMAEWTAAKLSWKLGWALAACLGLLLVLATGAALWVIPQIGGQIGMLTESLGGAYEQLRREVAGSSVGSRLLDDSGTLGRRASQLASQAAGIMASAVGALGATAFVGFVALYVAGGPAAYRRGVVSLVPPGGRQRAHHLLDALASTLRRWLLGRIVSMTAVGAVTTVGLWLLGIPLPLTLGLLAGLLGFIPNVGPIVSAVPAALLAFTIGPLPVVYVTALYLAVNVADGYALTPWIQKKAVTLPPALIIVGQVVGGTFWGVLGVMFATPLLACLLVLVRELYVRRLDEHAASEGQGS